jgi:hypothetical protein
MPRKSKHEAFRSRKSKPERFVEMGKLTAKLQLLSHYFHKTMGGGYAYCAKPVLNFCFGEIPVLTGEICYLQCLVYKVLVQPTKKKKMVFPLSAASTNLGSMPVMESTSFKRKKQKLI